MAKSLLGAVATAALLFGVPADAVAAKGKAAARSASKTAPTSKATITEKLNTSPDFSKFAQLAKSTGVDKPLSEPGPYTVFAWTDAAFGELPASAFETMQEPANKNAVAQVMMYSVVAGRMTNADLKAAIKAGGGTAKLTTLHGAPLTASETPEGIVLKDATGRESAVAATEEVQANGVIHGVKAMIFP